MVSSKNEAAVIDPRRDCDIYVETSKKWEAKIKYVFETHRNEDYVIGSVELAKLTGAQILHGPDLNWGYGSTISDKQEFVIGALKIIALHTPGHSPDSSSYGVIDTEASNQPILVFTGDTIFVGNVGRTDFLGPENTPTMSEKMYSSIFDKILVVSPNRLAFPMLLLFLFLCLFGLRIFPLVRHIHAYCNIWRVKCLASFQDLLCSNASTYA